MDCRNLGDVARCAIIAFLISATVNMTLFRQWRQRLGLSQRQAAELLGYCKRRIETFDRGEQDPPKRVRLGMSAVEKDIRPFSQEDIAA